MMKIFCYFLFINIVVFSQEFRFPVKANEHCRIIIHDRDSLVFFTLFDNILKDSTDVYFIHSDFYSSKKQKYPDAIVLPLPILQEDIYYIKYQSNDSIKYHKLII